MKEKVEEENVSKKHKIKERIKTISIILLLIIVFAYASTDAIQQNIELKKQIENITSENANLIANNNDLNNKISEMEKSQTDASTENTEKNKQIANLQQASEDLYKQKEELVANNNALQTEKKQFEEQIKALESEKAILNSEINSLKSQLNAKASESKNNPSIQSSTIQEDTTSYSVYITDTGSKYHRSNCSYLKKSKHEIDKNSAISQGYTACSRCCP